MYNICRVAIISMAILSVCYANRSEQAFSSISYHRGDVPLSYNFSQIHIYSPTSSKSNVLVKKFTPDHHKEIELSSNHFSAVEQNVYESNANENEFLKRTEHDNNKNKDISLQNYDTVAPYNEQKVETPDYTVAAHQSQKETQIKENPQGFAFPKTQKYAGVDNKNDYQSLPIQYYLNRLIKANLNQAPKANSLGSPYNGNQLYFQNNVWNQYDQQPYEIRYTNPMIN